MLYCIINAGGKAERMGPWAPLLKPFLGIGPFDERLGMGNGPSPVWRWCYWLSRAGRAPDLRIVLSISGGSAGSMMACLAELYADFKGLVATCDDPGLTGTLAGYKTLNPECPAVIVNGDDLLPGPFIIDFVQEFARNPRAMLAVATDVEQCNEFGVVDFDPHGYVRVLEKPAISKSTVGCGMLGVPHGLKTFAMESGSASQYLNALSAARHAVELKRIEGRKWNTITDPARYMAACRNPAWKDEAAEAWPPFGGSDVE